MSALRAVVVGSGSAGRRHALVLREIEPDVELCFWRRRDSIGGSARTSVDRIDAEVATADEVLAWRPDIAIVASPASLHVEHALPLVRGGVPVLIEKPLSASIDGVGQLLSEAATRAVTLMIGYNLRFDCALRAMKTALAQGTIGRLLFIRAEVGQYLPDWRPGTDYRTSVSARPELGGGALLELSHELDYVRWLGGEISWVWAYLGRLGDLGIDVEDTAEVVMGLQTGAMASVHLDLLQRRPVRLCRAVGTEASLVWDGILGESWIEQRGSREPLAPIGDAGKESTTVVELRHFLECVRTGRQPEVTGGDGYRVLQVIHAARQSAASGGRALL